MIEGQKIAVGFPLKRNGSGQALAVTAATAYIQIKGGTVGGGSCSLDGGGTRAIYTFQPSELTPGNLDIFFEVTLSDGQVLRSDPVRIQVQKVFA